MAFDRAELIEFIREHYVALGESAGQIATLTGKTRNTIIGLIHRNGISRDAASRVPRPKVARLGPLLPAAPRLVAPRPVKKPTVELDPSKFCSIGELDKSKCHYDIGGPFDPPGLHCGQLTNGTPYCDGHAAMVYQPRKPAQDVRPKR